MANYVEYNSQILKSLQQLELDMLKEFDGVCKLYNIKYFAFFGTAIGAIRHRGFIPWDDDIDIGIFREDYEKLQKVSKKIEEGGNLFIGFPDQEVPYLRVCNPKLYKKNTRFCDEENYKLTIARGKKNENVPPIWIDIFVFDKIEKYENIRRIANLKVKYRKLYRVTKSDHIIETDKGCSALIRSLYRKVIHKMLNHLPGKEQFWLKKYNKLSKNIGEYVTNFDTMTYKEMFLAFCRYEDMLPIKYVPFEDFQIPVPKNIEEILHNMYGDYMKLPPIEKRINHAPYILDLGDGINVMENNFDTQ